MAEILIWDETLRVIFRVDFSAYSVELIGYNGNGTLEFGFDCVSRN